MARKTTPKPENIPAGDPVTEPLESSAPAQPAPSIEDRRVNPASLRPILHNEGDRSEEERVFLDALPSHEQECLDALTDNGYRFKFYRTKTGKLRGIVRGVEVDGRSIQPNSWNPNEQTDRQQAATGESVSEFGELIEVLVRPTPDPSVLFEILDGEHRWNELNGGVMVVNVVFGLTDAEAKKLTIIMNETRGQANKVGLAQLLAEIGAEMGDEEIGVGLPYTPDEIKEMLDLAAVNWDTFGDPEGESQEDDPTKEGWTTIVLHLPTEALDVVNQAYALVSEERDLNKDRAIAWGQFLESLAADYLATPRSEP